MRACFSFVAVLLVSCGPSAGVDAGTDAGGGDVDAAVPEGSHEAIAATVEAVSAALALGAPLVQEGAALRDDGRAVRPGSERDTSTQERIEDGVSGNSIVTDPMCVAYGWDFASETITVTVTFSSCVLEATGETLDGAFVMGVSFGPTELQMTFTALSIGGLSLDGDVTVRLGGRCGPDTGGSCLVCRDVDPTCMEMQANQQTLIADLTVDLGGTFNIVLDETTITTDASGTALSGGGSVSSSMFTGNFTLNDAFVAMGDCLPSTGSVDLDDGGGIVLTYTFLSTTPDDGAVLVQLNGFPPISAPPPTVPVFMACM